MESTTITCPGCNGKGKVYWNFGHSSTLCSYCLGKGYVSSQKVSRDWIRNELRSYNIVLGLNSATKSNQTLCPGCNGKGKVYWNFGRSSTLCPICLGEGHMSSEEAMRCKLRHIGFSEEEVEIAMEEIYVDYD